MTIVRRLTFRSQGTTPSTRAHPCPPPSCHRRNRRPSPLSHLRPPPHTYRRFHTAVSVFPSGVEIHLLMIVISLAPSLSPGSYALPITPTCYPYAQDQAIAYPDSLELGFPAMTENFSLPIAQHSPAYDPSLEEREFALSPVRFDSRTYHPRSSVVPILPIRTTTLRQPIPRPGHSGWSTAIACTIRLRELEGCGPSCNPPSRSHPRRVLVWSSTDQAICQGGEKI